MVISPDSISYPTLGALDAYYGDTPVPQAVRTAAHMFLSTVIANCRAGRKPMNLNHIEYPLLRSFDVISRDLGVLLCDNAVRAHEWCVADAAEKRRLAEAPHPDDRVGNQAGYVP